MLLSHSKMSEWKNGAKLWGGKKKKSHPRKKKKKSCSNNKKCRSTHRHTHMRALSHSVPLFSEKHEDKASGQRGVMVCQKGRRGKKEGDGGGGVAPRVPPTAPPYTDTQTHADTLLRGPSGRVGVSSSRLKSLLFLIRYFSSGESKVATQQKAGNPSNLPV